MDFHVPQTQSVWNPKTQRYIPGHLMRDDDEKRPLSLLITIQIHCDSQPHEGLVHYSIGECRQLTRGKIAAILVCALLIGDAEDV